MPEIGYAKKKNLGAKSPRCEAPKSGWDIVKIRLVDINACDTENLFITCKLVGNAFNNGDAASLFASIPPLEALIRMGNCPSSPVLGANWW